MSIDATSGRYCDGCGRLMQTAHKLHEKSEYCGACYKRLFKRARCIVCSKVAVIHKNDVRLAVCPPCKIAARTCLRCDKPVPKAALIVDDRPVCPSCVPYFKEAQECARCHRVTSRLSTMPSAGVYEKICGACRNQHTHSTCSVCRKYRKVAGSRNDLPLCAGCLDGEGASHLCPRCGSDVPGKGASQCRACLNKAAVAKEIRLTRALFAREWVELVWTRFASWMYNRTPESPKVLGVLRKHQSFFERLDAAFASPLDVTGASLLQLFGTAKLRSHELPVRFFAEQLDVNISVEAKGESSEQERINETLIAARRAPWGPLLHSYNQELLESAISTRSRRMYLSSAALFCAHAGLDNTAWQPGTLERYLVRKPGTRNNLSPFVTHCRKAKGWDIGMPAKGTTVTVLVDPVRSAQKLRDTIRKIDSEGLENASLDELGSILSVSLGLARKVVLSSTKVYEVTPNSVVLSHGRERITLPEELVPYARRLVELILK
jgi:hypothetical protein